MENYSFFSKVAEKKRLTAEDKEKIAEAASEFGIALNMRCPNCYKDAAIQIAIRLKNEPQEEQQEEKPESGKHYVLCDDIDVTLHSFRYGVLHVCPKNCTDENARLWRKAGIPKNYFKSVPDDDNE